MCPGSILHFLYNIHHFEYKIHHFECKILAQAQMVRDVSKQKNVHNGISGGISQNGGGQVRLQMLKGVDVNLIINRRFFNRKCRFLNRNDDSFEKNDDFYTAQDARAPQMKVSLHLKTMNSVLKMMDSVLKMIKSVLKTRNLM